MTASGCRTPTLCLGPSFSNTTSPVLALANRISSTIGFSSPPGFENGVLKQPRPFLEFLDIARTIHQEQLLQVRILVRLHVPARRQVTKITIEELRLPREQEVDQQHGGMRVWRLRGKRHRGVGDRHWVRSVPGEGGALRLR